MFQKVGARNWEDNSEEKKKEDKENREKKN